MTYPKTPGHQSHSETSRTAAEELSTGETQRKALLEDIDIHRASGRTGDELSEHFATAPGTISARLIELEDAGLVIKTAMKRKTRANRPAFVYVSKDFFKESMGRATVRKKASADDKYKDALIECREAIKTKRTMEAAYLIKKIVDRALTEAA